MSWRPRKAYLRLPFASGDIDLHYRVAGQGPALLMLHPSPLSSAFMVPLMQRFASSVLAIAPDTPGYGRSTPIAGPVTDLAPYVEAMRRFVDALGLGRYAIYGSATGAQIAIELAKSDAARVTGVILDNAADFTDEECERIMQGYFPDLTSSEDGSHLARVWQVAHDSTLFFPWHHRASEHRIAEAPGPAEAMHMTALGYLQAGPGYEKAYRAAFRNERAHRIRDISAPVSIIRWESSILKRYTDRFDGYAWGEQVHMAHCGAGMEPRLACIEAEFPRVLAPIGEQVTQTRERAAQSRYVDTSFGQVRFSTSGEAAREILLHAPGASIDSLDATDIATGQVLIDLPGHGESDCPELVSSRAYLEACAESVKRVAEACALPDRAIEGEGASAGLAARLRPDTSPAQCQGEDTNAPPSVAPESSGAHLWRGWYWLRNQYLSSGNPLPTPARLTQKLVDLMGSQAAHRHLHELLEGTP